MAQLTTVSQGKQIIAQCCFDHTRFAVFLLKKGHRAFPLSLIVILQSRSRVSHQLCFAVDLWRDSMSAAGQIQF